MPVQNIEPTSDSVAARKEEILSAFAADTAVAEIDEDDDLPDPIKPIRVVPRNAGGSLIEVPPKTAADPVRKQLRDLSGANGIALGADARDLLLAAAVSPADLIGVAPTRVRAGSGWLLVYEARLFTPLLTVAVSNDRWVGHAAYDADPDAGARRGLRAVPLPRSHGEEAALVYESPQLGDLLAAADDNFREVRKANPQDVGSRVIEQPVTLVPTYLRGTAEGAVDERLALSAVDGNSRLAAAQDNLRVRPDWVPADRRHTLADIPRSGDAKLTLTLLANLSVEERRTLVRRIAKAAEDRLAVPEKSTRQDRLERNAAAVALNSLTTPARIIVGYVDDADPANGLDRFHTAVRALLMQMNVEARPLADESRTAVQAEQVVGEMVSEGLIGPDSADVLIGRTGVAEAMANLGLSPALRDLRAAHVLYEFTRRDKELRAILRKKLSVPRVGVKERSGLAAELALRSFTGGMEENRRKSVRAAADKGIIWQDLIDKNWVPFDIRTDDDVDALRDIALEELAAGGEDSGALLLLGVLGMFALINSGHLLAAAGSAEQTIGHQIERGAVQTVIRKLLSKATGVRLLAEAVKAVRGNRAPRWIDESTGEPVDKPEWTGATFSTNLRLLAKSVGKAPATVPVSARERLMWTSVAESVSDLRDKLMDLRTFRQENMIDTKLGWAEVEDTLDRLRKIQRTIEVISEPEPLDGEDDLL
ncbi:MAG: hypothetical protein ACRDUS_20545 [Mycobacterium sp.]